MNILITGCNGQLGNEIRLLENRHPEHVFFNTDVSELDITKADQVDAYVQNNKIDGIINCAAYTAVDKAESDLDFCRLLNSTAPAYLADAVQRRNGWMIQVSTDYVFDGTNHIPYLESDPTAPIGVYGNTKREGEIEVMNRCRQAVIIRTAWLYSTFGNNFVKTMLRLGREKQQLGVISDQIGTPTYAADLAEAILHIIDKGIVAGIYHYTDEGVAGWYDFTKAIHRIAGITTCQVNAIGTEDYPTPARRPHYSVLNKKKIKDTFDLSIPHWEESLVRCIDKLTNNA